MSKRISVIDTAEAQARPISAPETAPSILQSTAKKSRKSDKPKKPRNYSIDEDLLVPLAIASAQHGLDQSAIVCKALREYLKIDE